MAKNFLKNKRKSIIAALCAVTVTCTGLAAACAPDNDDDDENPSNKQDSALLKNGSFEYFNIPEKAVYLIKNVDDWTLGGGSSVKSGIIGTSEKDWGELSDPDLPRKLDYNYDVGSDSEDYVDYNSMRARDVLYKEPYAANLTADKLKDDEIINNFGGLKKFLGIEGEEGNYKFNGEPVYFNEDDGDFYFDADFTKSVRKAVIDNPETHYGKQETKDGKTYLGKTEVYKDEDGALYADDKKENTVGNVLMVHNYTTDGKYNGIQQYYSSNTITLEANTAAEISLWVKTSDLKFDKGYGALTEQDKGASIEVVQTVNGNSTDSFVIKNINTEKIIAGASGDGETLGERESNGWLNYKIYVNACDFASSTIQLRLGLGRENEEQVTGYAFFDDVTVTKYRTLDDENCGYTSDATTITDRKTSCGITSEKDDKIFNADKELRVSGGSDKRHAYDFAYAIDLASETGNNKYAPVKFGDTSNGVTVNTSLTSEKDGLKLYASSGSNAANLVGVTRYDADKTYDLVKDFKALPTQNDLVGIFNANHTFASSLFTKPGYNTDYSKLLNDGLTGDKNGLTVLPKYSDHETNNMLVTLSAWGAAYTSTVSANAFSLKKDSYAIVSFWVKTSDVDGTAATLRIYDTKDTDKKKAQSITVNSTGVTTNFENEKDIYNGWVPCFMFVGNDTDDNDLKTFNIDFCFGATTVKSASFNYGWAAIANMHVLEIDEEIYNLASGGDRTIKFTFDDEDENDKGNVMDEASGTSDIKTQISAPSTYNGLNGQNSSLVQGAGSLPSFDAGNTNAAAGLINKEYFNKTDETGYSQALKDQILTGFGFNASTSWENAFGNDCYQPLIIINNLRQYVDKAEANETNYADYYLECKDGETAAITLPNGKKYKKADKWDESLTYYSLKEVCNYGFVGAEKTVSSSGYETVSVRVMVTGNAKAYIYLANPDSTDKLMGYTTPSLTFYYDSEGNVLDEEFDKDWKESEHRNHIIYTLRKDGLYEDKGGKLFANLHNLNKSFKNYQFEHETFYNENGEPVSFDNLVEGEDYYTSADKATRKFVNHYLTATDGTRIYEYKDGVYYYIVDNKTTETAVENFEKQYARYSYEQLNEKYLVEIGNTNGKWVTVNFFIHAGSVDKKYRLELWSGKRDETGVTVQNGNSTYDSGAVAFDYSAYSVTSDNYSTVLGEYENKIIESYKAILNANGKGEEISSNSENIAYYEKAVKALLEEKPGDTALAEQVKAISDLYNAKYYTYTLYDAPSYIPFNEDTAESGTTGYDYKPEDFGELLAYFRYENKEQNSYNVFADYSAVDQSITLNKDDSNDDDSNDDDNTATGDLWLYISSIILVVVLLITLVAILTRDYLKKHRVTRSDRAKNKNVYRQRDRYIKKLHLVKTEEAEDASETTADEQPAEDVSEEVETQPEETVENAEESVEAPAEESVNEPAEEAGEEETPAEGEDKPE